MTDMFDLNDADKQREQTLIPPGVYRLRTKVRAGGAGPGSLLRLAKNGRTLMLDLEFKVVGGEAAGQKRWELVTVAVLPPEFEDANAAEREQTERLSDRRAHWPQQAARHPRERARDPSR